METKGSPSSYPSPWLAVSNGVVVVDGDRLHARLVGACILRGPQIAHVGCHLPAIKVESGASANAPDSAALVVGELIQKAGEG